MKKFLALSLMTLLFVSLISNAQNKKQAKVDNSPFAVFFTDFQNAVKLKNKEQLKSMCAYDAVFVEFIETLKNREKKLAQLIGQTKTNSIASIDMKSEYNEIDNICGQYEGIDANNVKKKYSDMKVFHIFKTGCDCNFIFGAKDGKYYLVCFTWGPC